MPYFALLGRILYSSIFIIASIGHFSLQTIEYAAHAGIPFASFLVPLSGIISLLGGLSILIGFKARIGACLLILFLIPVTIMMHNFWIYQDPLMASMQQGMFMKNLSLLGAAFLILYFGAGPLSVDHLKEK